MNTKDEITLLKEEIARLKEDVWMANACLDQVREWLVVHGIDVKHTPPMYYPEACQSVLARLVERQREAIEEAMPFRVPQDRRSGG